MATRLLRRGIAGLLLAACALPALSDPSRPRIGLVLGGGGARGTAHIGVLEVLDRLRIPVDCVAGTSMGALIAGAYLSGLPPDQMTARLAKVDWNDLFKDDSARVRTNIRERRLAQSYYPGLEIGATGDGPRMAQGVIGGQKIKLFFNTLVGADRGARSIESMPLPLSIIATDIGTGEKIVFRDGELAVAMRASMSVPAVLAPVAYRGRYLVDGGLVDNLPVAEARSRCDADVVIAIDVGSPLRKPEDVNSVFAVSGQMINILTEQNAIASRAMLTPGDVYIRPRLDGIAAADFAKFREGAARGREAAEAQATRLRRYAVPEADYLAWRARLRSAPALKPRIDEVQVAAMPHVNPAAIAGGMRVRPGQVLDTALLERDLADIYGEGDFESVDYALLASRERRILRVTPTEKPWGPDYLRFGVELQASDQENTFALRAAYHRKWLNALGGEWISGAQAGERATLFTEFYQPLEMRRRFFVEPSAGLFRDTLAIYQDDARIAQYELRGRRAGFNLGVNIGRAGSVRIGRAWRKVDATVDTGAPALPAGESHLKGWNLALDFDQLNRPFFPSYGWALRASYYKDDDLRYSRLAADLRAARAWGDYVVNGRLSYVGAPQGRLPLVDLGRLGGFLNLSGYARDQILAGDTRFASLRVEKIVGRMPLSRSGDLRIGISLEGGRAGDRRTETRVEGWQRAAAIYLGGQTPIGPAFVGYGRAEGRDGTFYVFIGLP
ncbi:MAG: patatin [Lysobacteraceae bacterium]|nr:MAG: patatin [Xanthomonadaceae bacterium]